MSAPASTPARGDVEVFNRDAAENRGYGYTLADQLSSRLATERSTDEVLRFGNFRDCSLLDIGCGDGYYTIRYWDRGRPRRITAIDAAPEAPRVAREATKQRSIVFAAADAACLPYRDDSFDVVLLQSILHHAADPAALVREAFRVAPRVVIHDPNGNNLGLKIIEKTSRYHIEHNEKSYRPRRLRQWVREAGGVVTDSQLHPPNAQPTQSRDRPTRKRRSVVTANPLRQPVLMEDRRHHRLHMREITALEGLATQHVTAVIIDQRQRVDALSVARPKPSFEIDRNDVVGSLGVRQGLFVGRRTAAFFARPREPFVAQDFPDRRRRRRLSFRLLVFEQHPNLRGAPQRMLVTNGENPFDRFGTASIGMVQRRPRKVLEPGAAVLLIALDPFVADAALNTIAPAQRRHGVVLFHVIIDEQLALRHVVCGFPRHETFLPLYVPPGNLFTMSPVCFVHHVPGKYRGSTQGSAFGSTLGYDPTAASRLWGDWRRQRSQRDLARRGRVSGEISRIRGYEPTNRFAASLEAHATTPRRPRFIRFAEEAKRTGRGIDRSPGGRGLVKKSGTVHFAPAKLVH